MSEKEAPPPGSLEAGAAGGLRDPVLWSILALAFAVRGALVARYPVIAIWRDESLHYLMSVVAANVDQHVLGHWAPGYEFFLGTIFRAVGPSLPAARWVQVGVSTLTVGLVYGIARCAGGVRAARIAGILCALYPSLVAYSHYIYSETLFTALLTAGVYVLYRSREVPRRGELVGAGAFFGLAILTRGVLLYFFPVWLGWLALGRRWGAFRRASVVFAVALAVLLPWTIRNAILFHDFILVDGTMGRTAWWAYNERPYHSDLGYVQTAAWFNRPKCELVAHPLREPLPLLRRLRELFPPGEELDEKLAKRLLSELAVVRGYAVRDLGAYQLCEMRNALRFIREKPALAVRRVLERIPVLWVPNSFLLRSVSWNSYPGGILGPENYRNVKLAVVSSYAAVVLLAILAAGRRRSPPIVEWVMLLCAYYTGIHALAVASTRCRLPLMPLLIVAGSLWLARPGWPETRERWLLVVVLIALFGTLCFDHLSKVLP
jgi:4-amino-4-deoxy-L-arabinose transferase-like glycosyltransferase